MHLHPGRRICGDARSHAQDLANLNRVIEQEAESARGAVDYRGAAPVLLPRGVRPENGDGIPGAASESPLLPRTLEDLGNRGAGRVRLRLSDLRAFAAENGLTE